MMPWRGLQQVAFAAALYAVNRTDGSPLRCEPVSPRDRSGAHRWRATTEKQESAACYSNLILSRLMSGA
jgi:hypothetical protein